MPSTIICYLEFIETIPIYIDPFDFIRHRVVFGYLSLSVRLKRNAREPLPFYGYMLLGKRSGDGNEYEGGRSRAKKRLAIYTRKMTIFGTGQQVYSSRARRNSKPHVSPERRNSRDGISAANKLSRLQRQSTAIDETCMPSGPFAGRRSSQPTLSADQDFSDRKTRRDSLSPDSAHYSRRRDSRVSVSIIL